MSKVAIKGADNGTGIFTIESPATNTDRTLMLPDEAGTVLTSVSDLAAAKLTGNMGKVLQVQSVTLTGRYTTTNASSAGVGTDIGLKVSITPKSATSKFLVTINVGAAGSGGVSWGAILSRDGVRIGNGDSFSGFDGCIFRGFGNTADYNHTQGGGHGQFLDTTTGTVGTARTYLCGFGVQSGLLRINSDLNAYPGSAPFAHSTSNSTITVMEIDS